MVPSAMCRALKSTFLDLSSSIGTNQDEKHELSALAELLAGVTASGAPFLIDPVTPGASTWNLWFGKMVEDTLGSCSLESATGAFSVAVRYIAHHLCQLPTNHSPYTAFVQLLLRYEEKTGTGQSTAGMKKLSFLHNAIRDINKVRHPLPDPRSTRRALCVGLSPRSTPSTSCRQSSSRSMKPSSSC